MSTPRSLRKSLVAALLAAALATPVAASPRLDALIELHRTEAAPTTHHLLRGAPSPDLGTLDPAPEPPALVRVSATAAAPDACPTLLRHSFTPVQGGAAQSLCQYQGKVVLIVNTASKCGYTYQYEGLEALYRKYRDRGLVVVGFPSDDFGGQEPGTLSEIKQFCSSTYGASFELFDKVHASGTKTAPYDVLTQAEPAGDVAWNFEKFLIGRDGTVLGRFKSGVEPESAELAAAIEAALAD
jgi:glutathione peroxidase